MKIWNATIHTMTDAGILENGYVCIENGKITEGSGWIVPSKYYQPIRQDAVLLKHGEKSAAAKSFLKFLQSAEANKLKQSYGYATH